MKKIILAVAVFGAIQGCAGTPYHHENDTSKSTAMNILEDTTRDVTRFVEDTPNGTDNFTERSLGEVMSAGLAVWAYQNPIAGIPKEVGAIAAYSSGFDSGAPLHRQPILSAYWEYEQGDDEGTAGQRLMSRIGEALDQVAGEYDGESKLYGVQYDGHVTYGLWSLEAEDLGCTENARCAIRAKVNANSWEGLTRAEWAGRNSHNMNERAWRTVSYTDKIYSQILVIKENGSKEDNLEGVYTAISNELPESFAIYLPPVSEFGIHADYPYILQQGEKLLFKK
tara:strand:+ start:41951 stop:42796 length:846 start_codon:yes stop_codon:yes gene_type:complete